MIRNPFVAILNMIQGVRGEPVSDPLRENRLLSYWCTLFDEFLCPPKEFYATVGRNLDQRKVPNLASETIILRESHLLSNRRLYLQMRRERLVFEICAAPFGSGYFVSSRFFDRRREATWLDFLILLLALVLLWIWIAAQYDSSLIATVVVGFVFTTAWSLMRLAGIETFESLDEGLFQTPCLGPVYETVFHPLTYFREDQSNMYHEAVHRAVMESLAELRSQKGLKPLSSADQKPILGALHR